MRAIIVAKGTVEEDERYAHLVQEDDLVIAADGGAQVAVQLGLVPDVLVGDLDSLSEKLQVQWAERSVTIVRYPARKDETDTELAIRYALQHGADDIVLLGAIGGRLDHTLANVLLLAMPELAGVKARILWGNTEVWLIRGGEELEIAGQPGDIVTLLPLGQDAAGITTAALEWALKDEVLRFGPARGVSNVMTHTLARVALRQGLLLAFRVTGIETERSEGMQANEAPSGDVEGSELVEVYVAQGHMRANVIKSKLEAAGIPAMLSYDSASIIFGVTVDGLGEVHVLVRPEDADEARRVVSEE